ncbi:hypothetical protein, partial [Brucella cytisi]|uniref:hypothetical protein n=1 Tax=Brucella cytisi TaxID=407152 RepID=UPI00197DD6AA
LSKIIRYRCGHPTLASIQPASVNQNKTDLGSAFDSEKNGNALERLLLTPKTFSKFIKTKTKRAPKERVSLYAICHNWMRFRLWRAGIEDGRFSDQTGGV